MPRQIPATILVLISSAALVLVLLALDFRVASCAGLDYLSGELDTALHLPPIGPPLGVITGTSSRQTRKPRDTQSTISDETIVHEREFVSSQVRVQMDCLRDKTIIKLNFSRPFNGIVAAGKLDTTKCKLVGNGSKTYELTVAHNETSCDTQWDQAKSSIFNTLFVRYHQSLETGNDLAKNLMCRLTVGDLLVGRRSSKSTTIAPKKPSI